MISHPENLRYHGSHMWVLLDDDIATVGVTEDLQHDIPVIESIDLPMIDDEIEMDVDCLAIHLPADLHHLSSPLTGRVIETNERVLDHPEEIFLAPYTKGWLYKMEYDEPDELEMLMTSKEYSIFLEDAE